MVGCTICPANDRYCCCRLRLANVILIGCSFCLLFVAFNSIQVLETTTNAQNGFISLMILYGVFAFFNIFTPAIIDKLGHRLSLTIGGATYVLYVGANLYPTPGLLFTGSAVLGMGAALLWAAQGGFLTRCADKDTLGLYNGLFFALFMANYIIGNVISGVLLQSGVDHNVLIIVFVIIGSVAVLSLLLLRNVEPNIPQEKAHTGALLVQTIQLFADKRLLLLLPLMMFSGLSQEYFFGQFPAAIGKDHQATISYSTAAFGAAETIGSILAGRISDRTGRWPLVFLMFLIQSGGLTVSIFAATERSYMFYIATTMMGFGDSICNTQIYAVLGFMFPKKGEAAFASFKLVQAFTTACAFAYGPYVGLFFAAIILYLFLLIGVLFFTILAWKVAPIDEHSSLLTVDYMQADDQERVQLVVNTRTDE